ncbi:MAG: NAD(P)H-hydrate epimerase [Planctomycetaceae bacterium]
MASDRTMSREEVRTVDRLAIEQFGMPGVVLMENAGRGATEVLLSLGVHEKIVICCGKGNNGGDGFVLARHLENHGCEVQVILFCDPESISGDAAINLHILQAAGTPLLLLDPEDHKLGDKLADLFASAEWIVDALLGTGTVGELREPFPTIIDAINHSPAKVLAMDLPSGLDCDTGKSLNTCVHAHHTVTFVARKQGFDNPESERLTGAVYVVDIGVPIALLRQLDNSKSGS